MKTKFKLLALSVPFLLLSCIEKVNKKEEVVLVEINEEVIIDSSYELPFDILDNDTPPYDLNKNAGLIENAVFAWKEMIALSWQSTYSNNNIERGQPNTSWNYSEGTPEQPLVWETFAHRIEYRPKGDVITKDFNSKPSYPFVNESEVDWNGIDSSEQFVVLDEDNEIGSCYVFAEPNITNITPENKLVMYMAKVNEVEYDYRKQYFNSHDKIVHSISTISDTNNDSGKKLLEEISTYQGTAEDPCGSVHYATENGVIVLPCSNATTKQRGVLEVKTAWRPLVDTDNEKEFLVRDAVVFSENEVASETKFVAHKVPYVLIGMHIIHKTNNYRNFFIASWEHNSLDTYGYKFVVNDPPSPAPGEDYQILPVERHDDVDGAHSYIKNVYGTISDLVQAKIKAANPENPNFLANYRLIGFQSDLYPDSALKDRKKQMPAYYLANLVIESDSVLADFTGSSIGTPFNNLGNVVVDGKFITAGGCVGCHGVAQQKGSDFSFLNDTVGKPIPSPEPYSLSQEKIDKLLNEVTE